MTPTDPAYLDHPCATCGEETLHTVLREREGRAVLQCRECESIVRTTLQEEKPLSVPLVISDRDVSRTDTLKLYPDEELTVGDQLFHDGHNLLVTALEVSAPPPSDGPAPAKLPRRRVESAPAPALKKIWAKLYDTVRVGVAVNRGYITTSGYYTCPPEEELAVGDEMDFGGETVIVVAIKTEAAKQREGWAKAGEVKRLYTRPVRRGRRDDGRGRGPPRR